MFKTTRHLVCPVHGEHEAVMFVSATSKYGKITEEIAFCVFCYMEILEKLGVNRMQIKPAEK